MATSLSSNHLPFHALLEDPAKSTKNSTAETLLAIAERKGEGSIASNGAFAAFTGAHTGRSPKDKFIFVDDETRVKVAWGEINQAMQPEVFDRLAERFLGYLKDKELFVEDLCAGADRIAGELSSCFASFLTSRPGPSKQQPCSARAIQHSLLRSWHQVRFALKAERQMSLRVIVTPFCHRPRNLIGRQQCHCGCAGRTQRTRPGIV